jgi:hypothetical protein
MKIINLTPHAIHCLGVTFPPSGQIARCKEITKEVFALDNGMPLVNKEYGYVEGLPDSQADTLYIVSMMIRLALPNRLDLVSPGDAVRDNDGRIVGCTNFVINALQANQWTLYIMDGIGNKTRKNRRE